MAKLSKFTSSDKQIVSDTTLQDHAGVSILLDSNEELTFSMDFCVSADPAGDMKFKFALPAGAEMKGQMTVTAADPSGSGIGGNVVNVFEDVDFSSDKIVNILNSDIQFVHLSGYITTAGNEGKAQFQWAQNTSNANPTTVYAGLVLASIGA